MRSDGAPSLPARSLRECLADGGALETAEVEVEGEEEAVAAGVATKRSARDLWGVATPAAVTGDAATAPTAGSGNVSAVGIVLGLVAAGSSCGGEVVDKRAETNSEGIFMGCWTSPDIAFGSKARTVFVG